MIRLDLVQGTAAWFAARAGIPTASCFDKLLTPKKLEPSASSTGYRNHLIAEWFLGKPLAEEGGSGFTARGQDMEEEARDWYEMQAELEILPGGFCLRDDRRSGCSPDGFVGDEGLVQIKIPSAANHIGFLLDGQADAHRLQMQGELWVTGRSWSDLLVYNSKMPTVLIRTERDENVIHAIEIAVNQFCDRLAAAKEELLARGYKPLVDAEPSAQWVG